MYNNTVKLLRHQSFSKLIIDEPVRVGSSVRVGRTGSWLTVSYYKLCQISCQILNVVSDVLNARDSSNIDDSTILALKLVLKIIM